MGVLKVGGPTKADLLVVDLGDGPMLVKDFSRKPAWARLIGRIQIRREHRAYRWLGRTSGVPAFVGRVDAHALAIEKVDGDLLAFATIPPEDGKVLLGRLRGLLDRLHARGLVHNDLRGRDNVVIRADGEPIVVDLAGAICLRPGSLAHRLLFRWLALTDEAAFLKWKAILAPGGFSPAERRFLRRFRLARWLWPFNRKRSPGSGGSP